MAVLASMTQKYKPLLPLSPTSAAKKPEPQWQSSSVAPHGVTQSLIDMSKVAKIVMVRRVFSIIRIITFAEYSVIQMNVK